MNEQKNPRTGFARLLSAAMALGTLGVFIRLLEGTFGGASIVAIRYFSALVLLIALMALGRTSFSLDWKSINKLAFITFILATPLSTLTFTLSVIQIKASNTVFYLYAVVFVATLIIDRLFMNQPFTRIKFIALGLALIGMFVFSYPLDAALNIGVVFALLTGVGDTVLYVARKALDKFDTRTLQFYQNITSVAIMLLVAMLRGETVTQPISIEIIGVIIIVVVLLGIVQLIISEGYLIGFLHFPLNLGSIVMSSELFFAIVVNALVLREHPTYTELAGAGLIILATIVVHFSITELRSLKTAPQSAS